MTTKAAARIYEAQHMLQWEGQPLAVFNPHGKPVNELPVIYGFNNGGKPGWMLADLLAEDGTYLGGHVCSSEAYMPHDLGCIEGSRPDRHETFRKHYPDGYAMDFVSGLDARNHAGLQSAIAAHKSKADASGGEA